ncbi:MAG: hypothetical protein AB7W59_29565 [Acidimicrobiia bacterium]
MNSHLERNLQHGADAVAARRRGYAGAVMGCNWSTVLIPVAKPSTFANTTKRHGTRPEEAPYG